jgi:nucleoside phosphorylase
MSDALQRVDVGILTFREEELAAVLERFPPERIVDGRRMYNISRVPLEGGESYSVAITGCVEATGSGDAAEAVRNLVEDLGPSVVLMVDVATAMPSNELTLGDVIVATRIVNVRREDIFQAKSFQTESVHKDVLKWASNAPGFAVRGWDSNKFTGPVPTLPAEPGGFSLIRIPTLSSLKQHFSEITYLPVAPRTKTRQPRLVTGTLVSTDRTIEDLYIYQLWEHIGREFLAIETKTLGCYAAARTLNLPLMSIRGIAEVFGVERDPLWVSYACKIATSFALAFLEARPIVPHKSTNHDRSTSQPLLDRPITLDNAFPISQLALSNVRGFSKLDLPFSEPARQAGGSWSIFLGDNGVGKTTILRALTLALAPAEVAPLILGRAGPVSPTIRAGTNMASIRVDMPGEEQITKLHIVPIQGGERLARGDYTNIPMPFLVAYGSRRGSGLAGSTRSTEFTSLAAVETLFDEGANLIQPDVWLKGWQLAALQGGEESQDARFFNAIIATLCAVLPDVKHIHVTREAVEVEGPSIGRVPLGALSDGYRTTMGWILDMIARWVEEAKRRNIPIDKDFNEKMTGIALVDEIDLYLHPRWQRDVITMVRTHFPRMSFVVTTHNPMTLLGAKPGEIYVLRRNQQGDVEIIQRDVPPGLGAEQVLTGDWFGLPSTLDNTTLEMLARHQRLIQDQGIDAPEAVKMEEDLRRRLGSYADTSIERLAHEAMAKVIDGDIRSLTPEMRQGALDEIAAELRELIPTRAQSATRAAKRKPLTS